MNAKELKVSHEIVVPISRDRVWNFLLNEEKMKLWFNAKVFVIDAYEGGEIKVPYTFQGLECQIEGEIGLILPKEKFVFTWNERNKEGDAWFNNTTVTIKLSEVDAGTQITVVHDGFKFLPKEIQQVTKNKYESFWQKSNIMNRLQTFLSDEV